MMRTCRFVKTGLYVASLFFEKAKDSNFILWARQSQVEITYSLRGKGFSRRLSN